MSLTADLKATKAGMSSGRIVFQLARFEGRRQFRSPFLWLAAAMSGFLVWFVMLDQPATLYWRSVALAGASFPLAVVAMVLGNASALRDHSTRVGETIEVPPAGRDLRMLGLTAAAWTPFLVSLAVSLFAVVFSLTDDPAGTFNFAELAVGPLVVLLGQSVGVLLGRWIPSTLAVPLVLVVLAGLFSIQDFWPGERTIPAASPFLPWRKPYTDWVQAEPRMPLMHLAYLLGLTGFATALASRRWRALIVSGIVVLGACAGLARVEVAGEEVVATVDRWADTQQKICEEHGGVTFCALDGYESWIDDWSIVVDRIRLLVPGGMGLLEVRQTPSYAEHTDSDPTVAHVHGRLIVDSDLTKQILAPELGLPGTRAEAAAMHPDLPACMASSLPVLVSGQARGVAFAVLTELAVPGSLQTAGFGETFQMGHIEISIEEAELAFRILDRPREDILTVFHDHWNEVMDPRTTTASLASWFGLEAPGVITRSQYADMECTCTADGGVSCTGGSGG